MAVNKMSLSFIQSPPTSSVSSTCNSSSTDSSSPPVPSSLPPPARSETKTQKVSGTSDAHPIDGNSKFSQLLISSGLWGKKKWIEKNRGLPMNPLMRTIEKRENQIEWGDASKRYRQEDDSEDNEEDLGTQGLIGRNVNGNRLACFRAEFLNGTFSSKVSRQLIAANLSDKNSGGDQMDENSEEEEETLTQSSASSGGPEESPVIGIHAPHHPPESESVEKPEKKRGASEVEEAVNHRGREKSMRSTTFSSSTFNVDDSRTQSGLIPPGAVVRRRLRKTTKEKRETKTRSGRISVAKENQSYRYR